LFTTSISQPPDAMLCVNATYVYVCTIFLLVTLTFRGLEYFFL
jgi:hypothetical protein